MKKYAYLMPLIVLTITVIHSCYIIFTTNIVFGTKHYFGFSFVFVGWVCSFIRKELGVYLTGITILAGTFNLIAFTPAIEAYSFGFSFNNVSTIDLKIQLYSFLLLILYAALNIKFLITQIRKNHKQL